MVTEDSTQNSNTSEDILWYLDNYILLRDYLDRTVSRIAARCVRSGNIAIEEYPFYGYILDVLEEITETGDFIIEHRELHPYVEKKIRGGLAGLRKNLQEYKQELTSNSSPEMIKQDDSELEKMKKALGGLDKSVDPTAGAGMSMDEVVNKILQQNNTQVDQNSQYNIENKFEDQKPSANPDADENGIVPPPSSKPAGTF